MSAIKAILPAEGRAESGDELMLVGENFRSNLIVWFGGDGVSAELVSSNLLKVITPKCGVPGSVDVVLTDYVSGQEFRGEKQFRFLPIEEAPEVEAFWREIGGDSMENALNTATEFCQYYNSNYVQAVPASGLVPAASGNWILDQTTGCYYQIQPSTPSGSEQQQYNIVYV